MNALTLTAAVLTSGLLLTSCGTNLPLPGGNTLPTQNLSVKLNGAATTTLTIVNNGTKGQSEYDVTASAWKGTLARGTYTVSVGRVEGLVTPEAQTVDLTKTDGAVTFTYQAVPPQTPAFAVQGRNVTVGNTLMYGGGDVKVSLLNLPEGARVDWTISQGEITPGEGGTATLPYSSTNREVLTGGEIIVTASVNGQAYRKALHVDDAAPLAEGGVLLTRPGGQKSVLTSGDELPSGTTFEANFRDSGVGMAAVTFAAWRSGLPVWAAFTTTDQLPEPSNYELRTSGIQDRLGNRVGSEDGVLGTFGTDHHAPEITADRPSGSVLAPVPSDGTSAGEDTLTFLVADPRRLDGSVGSGIRSLTVTPAGTASAGGVTVTYQQLRKAGVTGNIATITVTATDEAGNTSSQVLQVKLP